MAKSPGGKKPLTKSSRPAVKHAKKSTREAAPQAYTKFIPLLILVVTSIIVLQARIKLLAIPMERDEGGFAYIGHWLFNGRSLYTDFVDNKLPGLYTLYGLFTTIFGYHASGVHAGLLVSAVATSVCFYFLLDRVYNRTVAAYATAFLLILQISYSVNGFAAHATQLLLPFVIGGFLVFWNGIRSGRLIAFLLAGLLLGTAFLIKQQSVLFGLLTALLWWPVRLFFEKKENVKQPPILEWIMLGIGGMLPVAVTLAYFAMTSRLDELYFWTVTQPSRLAASFVTPRWELFSDTFPKVIGPNIAIWITALSGLIITWISGFKKSAVLFASLFAITGLVSVVIGTAFYKHYYVVALPGIALLAGVAVFWVSSKIRSWGLIAASLLAVILIAWPLIDDKDYFFNPDFSIIHQQAYSQNMFPELERIGQELGRRVPQGQRIAIMGSEPEVLVAADRESCSKHLFMYPLLSDPESSPGMQEEYVREVKECAPEYIVWSTAFYSWASGYENVQFFQQLMQWINENYSTTGIAELRYYLPGEIAWDAAVSSFESKNDYKVYVFRKN